MQPFSKALTRLALPPPSLTDTPSSNTKDFEAMEDKLDALVKKMQHLEFEDPRIKTKADEISQAILISIRSKQTQQQKRKWKKVEDALILNEDYALALEEARERIIKALKGKFQLDMKQLQTGRSQHSTNASSIRKKKVTFQPNLPKKSRFDSST